MLNGKFKKRLDRFELDTSLTIGNSELLVILGASGCGKSTLLNCIAGFIEMDECYFEIDKAVYEDTSSGISIPIHRRQIAYIQQGNTVFPHLSVRENILYSVPKKNRAKVLEHYFELLKLLDIEELEHRSPKTLSGGQNQRVSIGRSLMMEPRLILWDEPFSALDHSIREELRTLVISLKQRLGTPMIFVTHDLEEAFQLADRLAVMSDGKILQIGERDRVFNSPINKGAGKVMGITNCIEATFIHAEEKEGKGNLVTFKCDDITVKGWDVDFRLKMISEGTRVNIGIRPEQILYVREDMHSEMPVTSEVQGNIFEASVLSVAKHLENYRLKIAISGLRTPLMMDIPRGVIKRYEIHEGKRIKVLLKYKRILIMDVVMGYSEAHKETAKKYSEAEDKSDTDSEILKRYRNINKNDYPCPIIGISGVSNSGKTTVTTQLIKNLSSEGYRIGTVKHDGHGFEMDHPGKDTYLHREAGAEGVAIVSRNQYSIIRQTKCSEIELKQILEQYEDMDLVIVEGYKFSDIPKFEVIRKAISSEGICRKESLVGVITDAKWTDPDIPAYGFSEIDAITAEVEKIIKEAKNEG